MISARAMRWSQWCPPPSPRPLPPEPLPLEPLLPDFEGALDDEEVPDRSCTVGAATVLVVEP